jgi:hypothetical protein
MVTHSQSVASHPHISHKDMHDEGLGGRVFDWVRQAMCGLHGHDRLLQFEHDRMFLRCVSCGHETHGWEVNNPRPVVPMRVETRRKALAHPQLIGERKIA